MKDLTKKALSLANKDGQKFIKQWILGFNNMRIIGIENVDYNYNWFLVVYEYIESFGHNKGKRMVSTASISGYWSGSCKSTYFGPCNHVADVHSEKRMLKLFGNRNEHYITGKYQCYRAKCMELNRKYHYDEIHAW